MLVNITPRDRPTFAWQNAKWWQDANRRAVIFARFWANVKRGSADECWLWTGPAQRYGTFNVSSNPQIRYRAHRFSWLFSRGDVPKGLEVCHACDVCLCVNPAHLFVGTHQQNHLDAVRKGRKRAWGLQKLNAAQVLQIRARAEAGERHRDIAADFGIARHSVGQIANRKTWAHLERAS